MSSRHLNLDAGTGAAAASRPPGREDYIVINRDSTWEEVIVDDQVGLICHGDHERNISTVILNILKTSQLAGQRDCGAALQSTQRADAVRVWPSDRCSEAARHLSLFS